MNQYSGGRAGGKCSLDLMTFDAQRTELQIQTERLHAFLGPVWAEQLLIALHTIALRQHRPFLSLVVSSTAYVVAHSNHFQK